MGKACVNLIGTWKKGHSEPLWVMTNLEAKEGQCIYFDCMKIEESFCDLRSLLGMTRLINKQQIYMEKMLALLLLAFTMGLLVGEGIRDLPYGEIIIVNEPLTEKERIPGTPRRRKGKKWKRYSGMFVLHKQKQSISASDLRSILDDAFAVFLSLVQHLVLTHV